MLNLHLPRTVGVWLNRLTQQNDGQDHAPSDTVLRWPPTPARVLASTERHAHRSLSRALAREHPKGFLLAHVPLHKLVRVGHEQPYREWLSRTGLLTVDFALCDDHGVSRAIVLMPLQDDQLRLQRHRDRLLRVLAAAELPLTLWKREWQSMDDEALRRNVFRHDKPRAAGYYADTPHAGH